MPSRRAAARDAWCLAKCVEFAALKHVRICRLLATEDESVVRVSERLHGLQPNSAAVKPSGQQPVGEVTLACARRCAH